jgi:type VI secretion system secreted protein VgrG
MSTFTQDYHSIGLETPLGKDTLLLQSFSGVERLSGLFDFSLKMQSEDGGIKAADIVGKSVDFFVLNENAEKRWFNGIVSRFAYSGKGDRLHLYQAQVVPWLWLLTRGSDCRVHECDESKNAKDIIDGLLGDLRFSDYEWQVNRQLGNRTYCLQYRETHFDFLSRLLEEEGIGYYFKHEKGKHQLVFTDHTDGMYDLQGPDAEVSLLENLAGSSAADNLYDWSHEFEYTSGKYALNDYNFEKPTTALLSDTSSVVSLEKNSSLEFYDFPGDYVEQGPGDALVKLRMEAEEVGHESVSGSSYCRSFSPGGRFKVKEHHVKSAENTKWVLTAVEHNATANTKFVSGGAHANQIYRNTFRCIPAGVVYRPPRRRPKPRVLGLHSAEVVGPSGEEIYTDEYARVKIQFPWDRNGNKDENSSMWVRVSTAWAGKQWGMVHIPRIGQEVLVSFLEGDPDRPVVTGMLYNADHKPPYTLPDNKTQSGIKSHSTKEGGEDNFNEIRFEDKKDEEEIYVHAEKDLNCVIENNETRKVGHDDKDAGDQEIDIYNDQKVIIGKGSGGGSQTVDIHKDRTVTLETGNELFQVKSGNHDIKVDSGKFTTKAMQSIELKVGSNSIKIDMSGITIKGAMINIEGQTMVEAKSPMTTVKGDGMLTLKGGLTMIN